MTRLLHPDGQIVILNPSEHLNVGAANQLADQRGLDGLARETLINWVARAEAHHRPPVEQNGLHPPIGGSAERDRGHGSPWVSSGGRQAVVEGEALRNLGQHSGRAVDDELPYVIGMCLKRGGVDSCQGVTLEHLIHERAQRLDVVELVDQIQEGRVVASGDFGMVEDRFNPVTPS